MSNQRQICKRKRMQTCREMKELSKMEKKWKRNIQTCGERCYFREKVKRSTNFDWNLLTKIDRKSENMVEF